MKAIIIAVLLTVINQGLVFAKPFRVPAMASFEVSTLQAFEKKSGQFRWSSGSLLLKFKVTTRGQGRYGPGNKIISWESESLFSMNEYLKPLSWRKKTWNEGGILIAQEKKDYDFAKGKAYYEKEIPAAGKIEKKSFDIPADTIDAENLPLALRSLPFEQGRDFEFHLLTEEPTLYKITAKFHGIEIINGSQCYKVEIIPDLGFLGFLAPFVPKTYFWHQVEKPHRWLKYEGLESGLNTPYVVMEVKYGYP